MCTNMYFNLFCFNVDLVDLFLLVITWVDAILLSDSFLSFIQVYLIIFVIKLFART